MLPFRLWADQARSRRPPWVLVSGAFNDRGGQEKANMALADYLRARGTPVYLVGHEVHPKFLNQPQVRVRLVARPAGVDFFASQWLRRCGRAVASRVCALRPETRVVVNGGGCEWADINWVHFVHDAWHPQGAWAPLWFRVKNAVVGAVDRHQERRALAAARTIIANSEQTRQEVITRLGGDPRCVHTVNLGADPEWRPATPAERTSARAWLGQPGQRPLAVFVGGLGYDDRKGFDTLWAAWRELCARPDWDVDLTVAGGGRGAAAWQERVAQAGLAARVRLIGFTDRVFEVLAAADLLISPVRYEPYGLNVQEAICRGVPALVSARAGVVEHFSGELRPLVLPNPDDKDDLVRRLLHWRADVDGWRERFKPLTERLLSHTWQRMAEQIVSLAEGDAALIGAQANGH